MKIGITYNLKDDFALLSGGAEDALEEFDNEKTVDAIVSSITKLGFDPVKLGGGEKVISRIKKEKPSLVFNIAEGINGRSREAQIPAILELMRIPHTHSDPLTLALTLDKSMTNQVVRANGIRTPDFVIVSKISDLQKSKLPPFPLIVKPAWDGSSKGIRFSSKVDTFEALEKQVLWVLDHYPEQQVIIETFIVGKEVTVGIVDNYPPRILGMMEIGHKNGNKEDFIYSLEVKRDYKKLVEYTCPPKLAEETVKELAKMTLAAYECLQCKDIARMDFRVDSRGYVYFIEVNPLPGLSPGYSDLIIMSKKYGIKYEKIIAGILDNAIKRYRLGEKN